MHFFKNILSIQNTVESNDFPGRHHAAVRETGMYAKVNDHFLTTNRANRACKSNKIRAQNNFYAARGANQIVALRI
jgi:hypothetical protein